MLKMSLLTVPKMYPLNILKYLIELIKRNYTRTCACIVARWWGGFSPPRGEGWGFGRNAGHGVLCAPIGAEKVEIETVRRFACTAADVQQEKAGKGEFAFEQPFSAWDKKKPRQRGLLWKESGFEKWGKVSILLKNPLFIRGPSGFKSRRLNHGSSQICLNEK